MSAHLALVPTSASSAKSSASLPRYLYRRGSTYYFKRKIPADCTAAFPQCQGTLWRSLGTDLLEKARVLLAVENTEFELTVATHRKAHARQRLTQASMASNLGRRQHGISEAEPSSGASHHVELLKDIEASLAQLRALVVPGSQAQVDGQARRAPAIPHQAGQSAKGGSTRDTRPTMLHLFEDWKLKQTRERSIAAVESVVMDFRKLHGPLAVEAITRQHARAFRDQLIERQLGVRTIENRIGYLSTLFRHGQREIVEHLALNPFENMAIQSVTVARPPKERRAYELAELNQLYGSRLYTEGHRPKGQARDAAYWAPLLGPFLGSRIEEVAQLRTADIQRVNGVWCVRICNLAEDQNVKNIGSFRRVPLHEEMIRCGFLAHVAAQVSAGHDRVFPSLSNDNIHGTWSNALGKWFGRYLDTIGLDDPRVDYHSFRYTFRQQCSLCGIDNEVRDALTGHWVSNSDAGRTYMKAENRQYPFPKLVEAMKLLRYDELRISHLHVEEPLRGVEVLLG
ncbi:hypothetical protein GCM10023165_20880 [Variovorax defluvii]|uniref:Core-binding (CB) domain-containing protein n=2 Tax=Variovorax defluvii TaxID=913761 RepID=A0ABP8HL95_9BURK